MMLLEYVQCYWQSFALGFMSAVMLYMGHRYAQRR